MWVGFVGAGFIFVLEPAAAPGAVWPGRGAVPELAGSRARLQSLGMAGAEGG